MSYKKYNVVDFLADANFKRWVLTPNSKSTQFWESISKDDEALQKRMKTARQIILQLEFRHDEPAEEEYQQVLKNILYQSKIRKGNQIFSHGKIRIQQTISLLVAATVILAAFLYLFTFHAGPITTPSDYITKQNPKGQRSQIFLPDGTKVWLHANSKIRYPEKFRQDIRLVELTGEAFFDVKKDADHPFTVLSQGIKTIALGTSFNVRSYPGEPGKVSLVSGKVLVSNQKDESLQVLLTPGQAGIWDQNASDFRKEDFDYDREISWINGTIHFDEASFNEVITRLSQWYGVDFIVKGTVPPYRITGRFTDQSLSNVLNTISFTSSFEYDISETKIYVEFQKTDKPMN